MTEKEFERRILEMREVGTPLDEKQLIRIINEASNRIYNERIKSMLDRCGFLLGVPDILHLSRTSIVHELHSEFYGEEL